MGGVGSLGLSSGVIVGRQEELATLERGLEAAKAGRLALALVEGEAGIGKSRLVEAFAEVAAAGGARVVTAACLELGTSIPYLPFAEMLRDLVRGVPEPERAAMLGPGRDVLEPLLRAGSAASPVAQARAGAHAGMSPELARLALFESLLAVTERVARMVPLAVVLEDVQWADRSSLDLVTFLARNLRSARIMLVMTARTEGDATGALAAFVAGLDRHHRVERIELGPLGGGDMARQLAAILGRPAGADVVRRIHARSGGNPLFAEELLAWSRSDPGRDAAASPRLRDMIDARMLLLPPVAHEVLRCATAAGRLVDEDLLLEASGLSRTTIVAGIRAAVASGVLVPASGGGRQGFAFRHDLVREAVAEQLLPGERALLHEAYAEALSKGHREVDPGELAFHWEAAGQPARALPKHIAAGLAARAVFAFEEAQLHLERALVLWPAVPEADDLSTLDHVDLLGVTADAASMAGDHPRAIELVRRVIAELATPADDGAVPGPAEDREMAARSHLRRSLWELGDIEGAMDEAVTAVRRTGPGLTSARANVLAHLGALLLFTGRVRQARTIARQALAVARETGAREEAAMAAGVLGWSLMYAGRVEAALGMIREGFDAAETLGELYGRALAHEQLARALEFAGRIDEAFDLAMAGVELCRRHRFERTLGAQLAAGAARCLLRLGRPAEASTLVAAALSAGPVGPAHVALLTAAARLHVERGELAEAETAIGEAVELAGATSDVDSAGWLAVAAASVALWRGHPEAALAGLRDLTTLGRHAGAAGTPGDGRAPAGRGVSPAPPQVSLVALGSSIGTLLWLGARAVAEVALGVRARGGDPAMDPVLAADRERFEGMTAWLELRPELAAALRTELALSAAELARVSGPASPRAADAWRRVIDLEAARPAPTGVGAYARLRLAESLAVARADRSVAAAVAREGLEMASGLGSAPIAEEIELLVRRARLAAERPAGDGADEAPPAPPPAHPMGLTEREHEVLLLVAAGRSNREIAERLFISPKTASVHVSNILGKLGVPGRLDAALVAQRVGIYEPEPDDGRPIEPSVRHVT